MRSHKIYLNHALTATNIDVFKELISLLLSRTAYIGFTQSVEEAFEIVSTYLRSPLEVWDTGSTQQKNAVHRLVFTALPPYDRNTGFGTLELRLPYQLVHDFRDDCKRLVEVAGVAPASKV